MNKVISIYELRTHLSKYIAQAKKGKTIYVGAYGQAEAVLAPLPETNAIDVGVWAHKKRLAAYKLDDLVGSDPDIVDDFEASMNRAGM